MKKILLIIGVLLLGGILFIASCDLNRMGKDHIYVVVVESVRVNESKLDNGEVMTRYVYNQKSFDKEGKAIEVEFTAAKELRQGAYLMLYVKKGDQVTSYDEVQWDEIPSKAQAELENYYMGH